MRIKRELVLIVSRWALLCLIMVTVCLVVSRITNNLQSMPNWKISDDGRLISYMETTKVERIKYIYSADDVAKIEHIAETLKKNADTAHVGIFLDLVIHHGK